MAKKNTLKMLSRAELENLTVQRLKGVLKSARAVHSNNEKELKQLECDAVDLELTRRTRETKAYLALVKEILSTREHIDG